ncbi:STAS domain-containing protein [Streptodolium elevatio]
MTTHPEDTFDLHVGRDSAGDGHIRVAGDLDWETADELTRAARDLLHAGPAPGRLRVACAGLTMCDSMGLAALLMIRRDAAAVGTALHLDDQPPVLRRLLEITGTAYLFGGSALGEERPDADEWQASDNYSSARPSQAPPRQ